MTPSSSGERNHAAAGAGATARAVFKFISLGDWGNHAKKAASIYVVEDPAAGGLRGFKASKAAHQLEPVTVVIARKMRQLADSDPGIRCVVALGDNFYEDGVRGPPPDERRGPFVPHIRYDAIQRRLSPGMDCKVSVHDGGSSILANLQAATRNNRPDPIWTHAYFSVHRDGGKPDGASYPLPWYVCMGNHDWRTPATSPYEQVRFTFEDRTSLWVMPALYFKVSYMYTDARGMLKRVYILMIDTWLLCQRKGGVRKQQKEWIATTLAGIRSREDKSQAKIVVAGHYPLVSNGVHCSRNLNRENLNRDVPAGRRPTIKSWLIDQLLKHDVDLYISGHNHLLEHMVLIDKNGPHKGKPLECIVSGSASKLTTHRCSPGSSMWSWIPRWRGGAAGWLSGGSGGSSSSSSSSSSNSNNDNGSRAQGRRLQPEEDANYDGGAYMVRHSISRSHPDFGLGYGFVLHSLEDTSDGGVRFRHTFWYLKPVKPNSRRHVWVSRST